MRTTDMSDDESEPFGTATADLGAPAVDLDRALSLAGEMEDDELIRRYRADA